MINIKKKKIESTRLDPNSVQKKIGSTRLDQKPKRKKLDQLDLIQIKDKKLDQHDFIKIQKEKIGSIGSHWIRMSATVPKLFLILIPGSGDAIYMRISSHGFHCSLAHQATISADFVQSCFACKIFLDGLNIKYINQINNMILSRNFNHF